jgi:hypothetical protein
MEPDPDAQLMLRLKNGEDQVLNELMGRWQQPLVAFICRYIGQETSGNEIRIDFAHQRGRQPITA